MHLRHARQDEPGEDRPAQGLRRRGGHHAHGRAAGVTGVLLPGGRSPGGGDPRRVPAQSVLQRREPASPRGDHGPRDLGADRRADRHPGGERRHGRNHHRRRSVSEASKPLAGRRRGRPGGIAVLGRRATPLSHGGHRRGFLAGHVRPGGDRPVGAGVRQGCVPRGPGADTPGGHPRRRVVRIGDGGSLARGGRLRRGCADGRDPSRYGQELPLQALLRLVAAPVRPHGTASGGARPRGARGQARGGAAARHGARAREGPPGRRPPPGARDLPGARRRATAPPR